MSWITTGAVNLVNGSNVVTGVGSKFLQDGRIGDGFRGPNGMLYEVTNVPTNTSLTIQPAYEGATVNAAPYFLVPIEGYVKDSADQLRTATRQIALIPGGKQDKSDNLTAFAGLTGAADRIPYFTGAGALSLATLTAKARLFNARTDAAGMRAEITAASSGANSDITSLSGLTTALSIAQGGTGGTTPAAARTGLGLGTSATLDTTGGGLNRIAKDLATMAKVTDGTWRGLGGFLDLRGTYLEIGTPLEVSNVGFVTGFVQLSNMGITSAILPGATYGHLTIVTPFNGTSGAVGQTTIRTVRSGRYETVSYATSDTTWSPWSAYSLKVGDFGVGALIAPEWPNTSLNNCTGVAIGMYRTTGSNTDLPAGFGGGLVSYNIRNTAPASIELVQEYVSITTAKSASRTSVGAATLAAPAWKAWVSDVQAGVDGSLTSLTALTSITSPVVMSLPTKLATFTLATLPSAPLYSGCTIMVSNAAGGAKQCTSNATVWQITNTTTTVS